MQFQYPGFVPMKYRQPLNVVLVLSLIIAIYLIGKKQKWWDKPKAEGSEVETDPNKPPARIGFNPANEVSKLVDLFTMIWDGEGQDLEAFKTILRYNDNETIEVHNEWRDTHAGGNFSSGIKPTLRAQVNAETIWWYRTEALQKKKDVITRLDRLNL